MEHLRTKRALWNATAYIAGPLILASMVNDVSFSYLFLYSARWPKHCGSSSEQFYTRSYISRRLQPLSVLERPQKPTSADLDTRQPCQTSPLQAYWQSHLENIIQQATLALQVQRQHIMSIYSAVRKRITLTQTSQSFSSFKRPPSTTSIQVLRDPSQLQDDFCHNDTNANIIIIT